jgi:ATP-dependent Clp protease ATP-binding subunit ClpC
MSMWERFTERARRSIVLAQEEAQRLGHNYIGTEHLLVGITSEEEGPAAVALGTLGLTASRIRNQVEVLVGRASYGPQKEMVFNPDANRTIELAFEVARELNHNYIGTEHLLLAMSRNNHCIAARVLRDLGATDAAVRECLKSP